MSQKTASKQDSYPRKEAQRRFLAALKAAVNTPPKPRKSVASKRSKSKKPGR